MGKCHSRHGETRARRAAGGRGHSLSPRCAPRPGRAAAAAAPQRRESPEGDSFAVSAFANGRRGTEEPERSTGSKQEPPGGDLKDGPFWENPCPLEGESPSSDPRNWLCPEHAPGSCPQSKPGPDEGAPQPLSAPPPHACVGAVVLPAEKAEGRQGAGRIFSVADGERAAGRGGPRELGKEHLKVDALQCDVSVEDDDHQEWTFTLYGFDHSGQATREDMSSLLHTIYEAVDASVNHSGSSSKTLRVKLTVSPESSGRRKDSPSAGQDREPPCCRLEAELTEDPGGPDRRLCTYVRRPGADPLPCCERAPYRVDENTERRNHYLDLAGIENYTSKFGPGARPAQAKQELPGKAAHPQSRSRSQERDAHAAHHRRSQVPAEHPMAPEPTVRALDVQPRLKAQEKQQLLKSPKGSGRPTGAPGGCKPGRGFGYHRPAAPPPAPQDGHLPPQPLPQPHGHKRSRQKSREGHSPLRAPPGQPAGLEQEAVRDLPPVQVGEGRAGPLVQRHEHHHLHEHHHHHHHHLPS